ncbi:MAG: hypothetical protein K2O67_03350, partial [Clostridia bacterium]|nr:hypothetical protein [Clostridia bacterium]
MKSKKRGIFRKAACIGLTAVMSATFIASQALAFADGNNLSAETSTSQSLAFENANGKVNLTDIKLNNMTKQAMVNDTSAYADTTRTVIVTLEGKALSEIGSDDQADREEIAREQSRFLKNLKKAGVSYEYRSSYSTIVNAVAVDVKLSALKAIKGIEGVSTVSVGSTYARPKEIKSSSGAQMNDSEIYENGIYKSQDYLDKANGSGMTVAILD